MAEVALNEKEKAESEKKEPEKKSGLRLGPWILGIIVLAGAIGGYIYWKRSQQWETTDDAQVDGRVYPVSARVAGTVTKLTVQDNQRVQAGDVLVEIDPRDFQVAVSSVTADLAQAEADASVSKTDVPIVTTTSSTQISGAEASVAEVRANIATAENQVEAAQAKLRTGEAMIKQAKANSDRAAQDVERFRGLVAKEEISRQQFDVATTTAAAQNAQVEATEAQLEEARQGVRVAQQQVAQQRARLSRAESDLRATQTAPQQVAGSEAKARSAAAKVLARRADVEKARLNLDYTVIKAPVAGIVSQRNVEVGQVVAVGQPLLAVVPLNDIWVTANYKESQLDDLHIGAKAEIEVDAFGGESFTGHVESISAATGAKFSLLPPENATGNYVKIVQRVPVKIVLDQGQHPERILRPGMSVVPKVWVH